MRLVRGSRSRSLALIAVAILAIFAIGGISAGLYVVAAMVIGTAAGVALLLSYGYAKRHLRR